jgi:hypothetical protein
MNVALSADANDNQIGLKKSIRCMLKVLRATPGVTEPRAGDFTIDQGTLPFVEYRATEGAHWEQPTRFQAQKPEAGHYHFLAILPGIGDPDDHVTAGVVEKWRTRCAVDVSVVFN